MEIFTLHDPLQAACCFSTMVCSTMAKNRLPRTACPPPQSRAFIYIEKSKETKSVDTRDRIAK